ncbi:hypothetical protein ADL15_02040 [Actinoplanes awajinensis subsp. mycoplanecinus]|uniref:Uncharacterized protein n=1 Tax=Actinoplanes awajinensis subsp. mycoplanecinus TaxID=135947 RepID=A0A0X3VBB4_9ACTN|nr:hypothetical protein ADL15_02040 [Actinoplanes awajinensis subsp. mycoplanecinus]
MFTATGRPAANASKTLFGELLPSSGRLTKTDAARSQAPKNATTSALLTGPSRNRFRSSTPSSAARPRRSPRIRPSPRITTRTSGSVPARCPAIRTR